MTSLFNGISHMQFHFIRQILDSAKKQLNFLNRENDSNIKPQKKNDSKSYYGDILSNEESSYTALEKEKRSKDIALFQSLCNSLGHEIINHGTSSILEKFILQEYQETTDIHQLINDYFINKQKLHSLEIEFQQVNTKKSTLIAELDKKVYKTQLERDDIRLVEECRVRTAKRWEDTRCDQNAIMFHLKEQELSQELRELDEAIDDDRMINFHTERHLDTCINDLYDTIGQWDDRITRETDDLENSLQQLSERRFNFEKRKKQCEELYMRQKEAIEELNEKMRKEKELILMAKCSIKIQAWWRGTMVRKKLGPFKPKSKKKKKTRNKGRK